MGEMEQRKIMALGQSSRAVTLPKTWLKINNLEKGSMVSMNIQRNGSLIINPATHERQDVRKINLKIKTDESEDSIIRRIIGSFLDGYTIIELTSGNVFSASQQKAIRRIVSNLFMMIIESKANSIVLETLVDESKASVSTGIQRMHVITYSMCKDILDSMKNWDLTLTRSVVSLEDDVDQLMFLLLRLIRKAAVNPYLANQLGIDPLDCLDYQTLVHRIERIADFASTIAKCMIDLMESRIGIPQRVSNAIIKAAEVAFGSYEMAVQSYLSRDIDPTNEIIDNQKEIEERYIGVTLLHFEESYETSILSNIITIRDCIMKISHHAADIAELTIDRSYRSDDRV